MQMVKIKFQNPADDAREALELAKHFTVICLPEDTYEVPEAALAILDELHLAYCLLEPTLSSPTREKCDIVDRPHPQTSVGW